MKIVTDTATLFSPAQGKELGIDVLPLSVTINKQSYREFVDINSDEFIDIINRGFTPTSSQPSIGETIEVFEKYKDEEILAICMADGLSGTYQSTLSAREGMEHKENIHVINSTTLCGPHRHIIKKVVKMRDAGCSLEEIKSEVHTLIDSAISFLIPQDFDFLKRGGRLTPLAARIGGLMKIIPVMTQTADGRRLEKFAVKKTMKGVVKEVGAKLKEAGVDENYNIFVSHAQVLEQATEVINQLKELFPNVTVKLYDLSPAFITQGGPKCVAIQAVKK